MGMGSTIKVALDLYQRGFFSGIDSVLDMGSQELHIDYDSFEFWCRNAGLKLNENEFGNLRHFPGRPRCSTRPFWNMLGVSRADRSDINREEGTIYIDLNCPLEDKSLYGSYDLVTDFGNNEHPFNVAEAYRTMHRLCRKGGYLWIDQSVYKGNGFFNFDKSFFEAMCAANGYSVIYSAYVVDNQSRQFHIACREELLDALDLSKISALGISYILRKNSDTDFMFPYQDVRPLQTSSFERPHFYNISFIEDKFSPARYYVPGNLDSVPFWTLFAHLSRRLLVKMKLRKA